VDPPSALDSESINALFRTSSPNPRSDDKESEYERNATQRANSGRTLFLSALATSVVLGNTGCEMLDDSLAQGVIEEALAPVEIYKGQHALVHNPRKLEVDESVDADVEELVGNLQRAHARKVLAGYAGGAEKPVKFEFLGKAVPSPGLTQEELDAFVAAQGENLESGRDLASKHVENGESQVQEIGLFTSGGNHFAMVVPTENLADELAAASAAAQEFGLPQNELLDPSALTLAAIEDLRAGSFGSQSTEYAAISMQMPYGSSGTVTGIEHKTTGRTWATGAGSGTAFAYGKQHFVTAAHAVIAVVQLAQQPNAQGEYFEYQPINGTNNSGWYIDFGANSSTYNERSQRFNGRLGYLRDWCNLKIPPDKNGFATCDLAKDIAWGYLKAPQSQGNLIPTTWYGGTLNLSGVSGSFLSNAWGTDCAPTQVYGAASDPTRFMRTDCQSQGGLSGSPYWERWSDAGRIIRAFCGVNVWNGKIGGVDVPGGGPTITQNLYGSLTFFRDTLYP
jgi:hypothetical protein